MSGLTKLTRSGRAPSFPVDSHHRGNLYSPSPGRKIGGKCFVDVGPVSARQCKTGPRVASVACEALNSSGGGGGATWPAQGAPP